MIDERTDLFPFSPSSLFPFFPFPLFPCSPSSLFPFFPFPLLPFSPFSLFPLFPFPLLPFSPFSLFPFFPFPLLPFPLFPFSPFSLFPFFPFPFLQSDATFAIGCYVCNRALLRRERPAVGSQLLLPPHPRPTHPSLLSAYAGRYIYCDPLNHFWSPLGGVGEWGGRSPPQN